MLEIYVAIYNISAVDCIYFGIAITPIETVRYKDILTPNNMAWNLF